MEKALKQRLVGAVVLVILGVVFIPVLLDGAGHHARYARDITIPSEPDIKIKTWDELKEFSAKPAATSKPRSNIIIPKEKKQASIHAWALQLGSFSQQNNALVLRDQLRAKGYSAYVEKQGAGDKLSYKVRIGPELNRDRMVKLQQKLKSQEKIDSIVVKHP